MADDGRNGAGRTDVPQTVIRDGSIVPTDRFNMSISVITVGFQVDGGHVLAEGVICNIA